MKLAFDRHVDAEEEDCTIDGCTSGLTNLYDRTVQMWRSRTRGSSHRQRMEKREMTTINESGEIQTKGDHQRRFEKLRLAVTKNNPRNAFLVLVERN